MAPRTSERCFVYYRCHTKALDMNTNFSSRSRGCILRYLTIRMTRRIHVLLLIPLITYLLSYTNFTNASLQKQSRTVFVPHTYCNPTTPHLFTISCECVVPIDGEKIVGSPTSSAIHSCSVATRSAGAIMFAQDLSSRLNKPAKKPTGSQIDEPKRSDRLRAHGSLCRFLDAVGVPQHSA